MLTRKTYTPDIEGEAVATPPPVTSILKSPKEWRLGVMCTSFMSKPLTSPSLIHETQ